MPGTPTGTSTLSMDVNRAGLLVQECHQAADELDWRRQRWELIRDEVRTLLNREPLTLWEELLAIGTGLRNEAEDVARRIRMVLQGGPGMNEALWAVDVLRVTPEAWGGDDLVSRRDLESFVTRTDALGAAARILLGDRRIFTMLDTAKNNKGYFKNPTEGFAASGGDRRISKDDLASFESKMSAFTTLLPYLAVIDTASGGAFAQPDGFYSEQDFQAVAADESLPREVRQAAVSLLGHGAFHRPKDKGLFNGPLEYLVDAVSLVPVLGDVVDATMALYSLSQNDWESALFYSIGLLPVPGVSSGALKATREVVDMVRRREFDELKKFAGSQILRGAFVQEGSRGVMQLEGFEDVEDTLEVLRQRAFGGAPADAPAPGSGDGEGS